MRPELISQPITGICSFGRYPICLDLDELKADFGVLGVPFDMGVGFLSGARMGPRRIREASTQYGRGNVGYYDYEADEQMLAAPITIADCGDADVLQGDRDAHLSVERDFRRYEALLAAHPDAVFHLYPGLNHLFMPSPTGAIAEVLHEYQQPQAVDSQVIADIARWILAHEGAG